MSDLKTPDVNTVLIAGTLINDPVLHQSAGGTTSVTFAIASVRKYRDNSGIWRENTCSVSVITWRRLAEFCLQSLKKKSAVIVEGDLVSRPMLEEDAVNRNTVQIRCQRIQLLDRQAGVFVADSTAAEPSPAGTTEPTPAVHQAVEPESSADQEPIGPTEFDFGYQDLKF